MDWGVLDIMFKAITLFAANNPPTPQNYAGIVDILVSLLRLLWPVLISLGILLFAWGIFTFMTAEGSEEAVSAAKKKMFWGVIAIFVMVSFWGIVSLFFGDIIGGSAGIPILPQ